MNTEALLVVTYIVGITAEAITAALSAGRLKMDWFGVIALASITALGGGTLRVVLLDDYPMTWVEHPIYLVIVVVAALATWQMAFLMPHFRRLFLVADAVGLATFSVLGTKAALELGHGFIIASVAATVTGVSGGVMRDIMSDRVPLVFSQEIYAAVSILTAALYIILLEAGVDEHWVIIISLVVAFGVRLLAIKSHKHFPQFHYQGRDTPVDPRLRLSAQFVRRGVRSAARRAGQLRIEASNYSLMDRFSSSTNAREQKWTVGEDS
ncbi:trimeric intracellular cation channel family protein [Corynebacterium tapiri]|uniref:Trimeric intracellular cation channel family protein n=1 Tax=Corynebacterium tapiri TaxID=1448266 RepID=A0A5C4U681_9CORY|nr:trimeric intracellular cation channel family protein [Corynebacterium tapiri]TNL98464.1 trimeric intracellular cation channel family protein [Corynebacterium tapiri]